MVEVSIKMCRVVGWLMFSLFNGKDDVQKVAVKYKESSDLVKEGIIVSDIVDGIDLYTLIFFMSLSTKDIGYSVLRSRDPFYGEVRGLEIIEPSMLLLGKGLLIK